MPGELRANILELAFDSDDYYPPRSRLSKVYRHPRYAGRNDDPTDVIFDAPTVGVLMVNKRIHQEISNFAQFGTIKCFRGRGLEYREVLISQTWRLDRIRILDLEMSHEDYMSFFGVEARPFDTMHITDPYWQQASTLIQLPQLKRLYLRFKSPLWACQDDPWGRTGDSNRVLAHLSLDSHHSHDWRGNSKEDGSHTSCQTVLIDWILTYGKEFLEKIPRVTLCGYIKNSRKAKWESILAEERNGIQHDVTKAKQEIESVEHEL